MPCIQAVFLSERSMNLVDRCHLGLEFMHNNFIACVSVASLLSSIIFLHPFCQSRYSRPYGEFFLNVNSLSVECALGSCGRLAQTAWK